VGRSVGSRKSFDINNSVGLRVGLFVVGLDDGGSVGGGGVDPIV